MPTIENEPKTTKPYAITLKNFSAAYNNTTNDEESNIRPRKIYSSAKEAWLADD